MIYSTIICTRLLACVYILSACDRSVHYTRICTVCCCLKSLCVWSFMHGLYNKKVAALKRNGELAMLHIDHSILDSGCIVKL